MLIEKEKNTLMGGQNRWLEDSTQPIDLGKIRVSASREFLSRLSGNKGFLEKKGGIDRLLNTVHALGEVLIE